MMSDAAERPLAIKLCDNMLIDDRRKQKPSTELDIGTNTNHADVMRLYAWFYCGRQIATVMQLGNPLVLPLWRS